MGKAGLAGKVALVTGATTGIGAHTALVLRQRGARVLVHGRDPGRTEAAAKAVGGEPVIADLSRLDDDRLELTADGYETTFQVNHLAPFLLTNLLLDRLKASVPARVVNVASRMHERVKRFALDDLAKPAAFDGLEAYNRSKGCNVLFTRELARRLDGTGVVVNSLHPGFVASRFGRDGDVGFGYGLFFRLLRPVMIPVEQGADTVIWLASAPEAADVSGRHFEKRAPRPPASYATDAGTAARLWGLSERLVGLG
jgi:retinol dehydrogenase-14